MNENNSPTKFAKKVTPISKGTWTELLNRRRKLSQIPTTFDLLSSLKEGEEVNLLPKKK